VKRLPLFLDGTWNKPDDNTNVYRAWQLIANADAAGHVQRRYYHPGVGTKPFDRLSGGIFGTGLEANIRDAYQWLIEQYDTGDKIYLFGFSRGAYTARSLAGLIGKCGLLWPGSMFSVPQVFERYRGGSEVPALYELEHGFRKPRNDEDRLLMAQSRNVDIEFIGVWDTVGALGLPGRLGHWLSRGDYYFHSTNPSVRYRRMYQALAIDENRPAYQAALWTLFQPKGEPVPALKPYQRLEQRWFAGAHCNVGGGYRNDALAQLPLAWILERAEDAGLVFRRPLRPTKDDHKADAVDSYKRFLGGVYSWITFGHRHYRPIGRDPEETKKKPGLSHTVNETIDESVFDRWRDRPDYRPRNLVDWARRRGEDPGALHGTQVAGGLPGSRAA